MPKGLLKSRLIFISPWLIAASIGLMTLIIVIFAANNLRREINLIHDGLFLRGQTMARFVGAGTRASMMQGMRGEEHTQRLIEQAAVDQNILYLAVVDSKGKIMAHSDPALVGTTLRSGVPTPSGPRAGHSTWQIVSDPSGRKAFEVVSDFSPFQRGRNMRGRQWRAEPSNSGQPASPGAGDWCRNIAAGGEGGKWEGGEEYQIVVGLDMTAEDKVSRQARLHIILLSLILLLVGLGGWLTMLVAQSYQTSQSTLKHIQAFTNLLILKLPVGIIATDEAGTIKTFNRAIAAMLAKSNEEVLSARPEQVLPVELAGFFIDLGPFEEVLEREVTLSQGPELLTVLVSSVPVVDHSDQAVGRVLLIHDVTELKKLEKEVIKHDRLVALGKMAAGVAHEVRNPLSSIKGFATLLGAHFSKGSEEQKASELLVNEVERLNRSITELLNYSRPLPLEFKEVDFAQLVADSLQLMQTDAAALGVSLRNEVAPDLPLVSIDADKLKQVLLNLYLNALQAMENGGELTVAAALTADRRNLQVSIKDTGCGINQEVLGRVVDPYFTTKKQGTGLGLALAYKIIDEHNGTMNIQSEPGAGTQVFIMLPL